MKKPLGNRIRSNTVSLKYVSLTPSGIVPQQIDKLEAKARLKD